MTLCPADAHFYSTIFAEFSSEAPSRAFNWFFASSEHDMGILSASEAAALGAIVDAIMADLDGHGLGLYKQWAFTAVPKFALTVIYYSVLSDSVWK